MRDDHQHDLAPVLSSYLNEHLVRDRGLSQLTRASYAHTFILLIRFIAEATRMNIDRLHLEDITAEIVLQFLDDLEKTLGKIHGERAICGWRRSDHSSDMCK